MTDKTREEFEAWARPLIGEPCYSFIMNLMWSGYQEGQRKQQAVIDALVVANDRQRGLLAEQEMTISNYMDMNAAAGKEVDALRVENTELRATIINAKGYLESNEIAWAIQELRG